MWLFKWLGIIWAALSLVMLLKQAVVSGSFVAPLQIALHYYENSMQFFFGWAELYLQAIIAYLIGWTGWKVKLFPHWKYVLVLMWLYFGSLTSVYWRKFIFRRDGNKLIFQRAWWILIATTALAGFIGLGVSVAAGTVAPDNRKTNVLIPTFLAVGALLYQMTYGAWLATIININRPEEASWWQMYRLAARVPMGFRAFGLIIALLILGMQWEKVPLVNSLSPTLALCIVIVIILAFSWLWTGIEGAMPNHTPQGASWWQTFRTMNWWPSFRALSNTQIGVRMLVTVAGAILFILANAGLYLAGL